MPAKEIISQKRYDEVEAKLVDTLEFLLSAQETVATRIYEITKSLSDKEIERNENGTYTEWRIVPKVSELLGYTSDDVCYDERTTFEHKCSIQRLLNEIAQCVGHANTITHQQKRSESILESVRNKEYDNTLPKDRTVDFGPTFKSEYQYERIMKNAMKNLRKELNGDYSYSEYSVSRNVSIYRVTVNGSTFDVDRSYDPNQRNITNKINKCARRGDVRLCMKVYSKFREESADEYSSNRSEEIVLWENPDEIVQAEYAFNKLL